MQLEEQQEQVELLQLRAPRTRLATFRKIPPNRQGFVLLQLSPHLQDWIVDRLSDKELLAFLPFLDPDEATDIVQLLDSPRRQKRLLKKLTNELKEKIEFLLPFHETSAAGIMDLNYIEVLPSASLEQVARKTKAHEKHTGKFPSILVVSSKGKFLGEMESYHLIVSQKNLRADTFLRHPPTISYRQNAKKALDRITRSRHGKIIVIGDDNSIMGVIYSDDLIRLLRMESSASLYNFAGVEKEEDIFDSVSKKVESRYKWLIINLGTAFLAAGVVSLFEGTISKYVFLAAYMPIVAGMGGNAATQTLAVTVRGIALGEIELAGSAPAIAREVGAGLVNGVINGLLVAGIALLWNQNPVFGFIIGTAMVANLVVAAFFGALIPLVLKRFGADPATSATVFITTTTDVLGFLIFLGLAALLLV